MKSGDKLLANLRRAVFNTDRQLPPHIVTHVGIHRRIDHHYGSDDIYWGDVKDETVGQWRRIN